MDLEQGDANSYVKKLNEPTPKTKRKAAGIKKLLLEAFVQSGEQGFKLIDLDRSAGTAAKICIAGGWSFRDSDLHYIIASQAVEAICWIWLLRRMSSAWRKTVLQSVTPAGLACQRSAGSNKRPLKIFWPV